MTNERMIKNFSCDDCDREYRERDDAEKTGHRWDDRMGLLIGCEGFDHRNR